jgi:hypothetical protein
MTAVSLGQAVRPSRLGRPAIAAAVNVGRLTKASGRHFVGPAREVREQFKVGNVTSRPREFAGGLIDFLLGRGTRHPG